ncbi:succinylglutamate desuccinylase/aspartoacylase family protein [Kiloniella laminariae]|uniref:Succinylglutamate desuccinylase/aspartoacylase family protein n=1 Tax=Kiloniella laminariae TaxID=454162 RepID=A0ABT4LHP5_9PROT|nr:succinylglutamate desuccinylase/aspartoacylase family protein [Kiloniella laminariae]MCZ4280623.1 succinylglutamate desuccinylase/aspartoacylase family protein [Kiloniella laminariae]
MPRREPFEIGGKSILPGTRQTIDVPVSFLSDHTPVSLSVHVVHGNRPGPTLFVSAAIHGDEVIGVEIVRRLLRAPNLEKLRGTLLAIPIVNSFGFMNHSRYLPDRRDLNRSFPGSPQGSLAGRLAHIFMTEIASRSDYGIDLHSAAIHRTNLPQIRVSPKKPDTMKLAQAFGAPLILTSKIREGSLRQAAQDHNVDILLYEAGEGLRFDEFAVRAGVSGILRVMREIGMISGKGVTKPKAPSIRSTSSFWLRAQAGGLLRTYKTSGDEVKAGDVLGAISDPFGEVETEILVEEDGLLIGRTNLPIVNEGDGLFHIARIKRSEDAETTIDSLTTQLEEDPLFDEDEII